MTLNTKVITTALLTLVLTVVVQADDNWAHSKLYLPENGQPAGPSPYPLLNGGDFSGPAIDASPDPLIRYHWEKTGADDDLQIYYLLPVSVSADQPRFFENLASLKTSNPNVLVKGVGSIRVDFGVESAAWLEFDSPDLAGEVTMSISEYHRPAIVNAGAQKRFKTQEPVKHGNTYRLELNDKLYEGVRFGWIHVKKLEKPFHITGLRLVCQIKPTNYTSSFACSDEQLNRIWYTGAYGVKLNLLQDYFGAILMERSDRHSWTGDAHTSQAASLVAFSNYDFVKHNIDRTAGVNNGIESYSLYWVLSLLDYYWYSADKDTLEHYIPEVRRVLGHALEIYGTNSSLGFYGHDERLGATFENPDCEENQHAYKMLTLQTCLKFASAMETIEQSDLRDKYQQTVKEKVAALRKDPQWHGAFGVHACADALNAGFVNRDEREAMFEREFTDPLQRISFSPFNQYFIIEAMAEANQYDAALDAIHRCWGGQLAMGGTSFWEVYRPSWQQCLRPNDDVPHGQCGYVSFCHPWGGGVTKWLSEEILGIRPKLPGFKAYMITPHLGSGLNHVRGHVITPQGPIHAAFDVANGKGEVRTPEGTTGIIGIPKTGRKITTLKVNGKKVWDGAYKKVPGIQKASEDDYFVYLMGVSPGEYTFDITYEGERPDWQAKPLQYAARFVGKDKTTSGNWPDSFGEDGYILFNYQGEGKHLSRLPEYVEQVSPRTEGIGSVKHINWPIAKKDTRVPMPEANRPSQRKVGAVSTQNPKPCYQSFPVDIELKKARPYRVALYFVDWDRRNRELGVEMFDLDSKEIIAPVQVLRDYTNGAYLIYEYDKSSRFRIGHIRGGNAVLSGIFFDPAGE